MAKRILDSKTVHDVSRIPVSDAFQMLAAEGLVDLAAPHAVVHRLSVEELQELYELREAVEPLTPVGRQQRWKGETEPDGAGGL